MFDVSPTELIFILLVALVIFGPRQLPDMARKVASWIRELQTTAGELQRSLSKEVQDLKAPIEELGNLDSPSPHPTENSESDSVPAGEEDTEPPPEEGTAT